MNPVVSVSFPRSGHKLATDWLRAYFGDKFSYAGEPPDKHCSPEPVLFLKRHDFDLDLPIRDDLRYLVQIRDPFESMHSWYEMTVAQDNLRPSRSTFARIFADKIHYWSGFVQKWVLPERPNVWVFNYRDVTAQPREALRRMVEVFGERPDGTRIVEAINRHPVVVHNHLPPFFL